MGQNFIKISTDQQKWSKITWGGDIYAFTSIESEENFSFADKVAFLEMQGFVPTAAKYYCDTS